MITPIEIRQQSFKKTFRGYDPEEVRAFLLSLSQEWEKELEESRKIKGEFEKLQANYKSLKEVESMLHKTLIQAEQSSKDVVENARNKAELKLKEAEVRSRNIVKQGIEERSRIEGDITELMARRDEITIQLNMFLKSQLDRLSAFEKNESEIKSTNGHIDVSTDTFLGNGSHNGKQALYDDIVDQL